METVSEFFQFGALICGAAIGFVFFVSRFVTKNQRPVLSADRGRSPSTLQSHPDGKEAQDQRQNRSDQPTEALYELHNGVGSRGLSQTPERSVDLRPLEVFEESCLGFLLRKRQSGQFMSERELAYLEELEQRFESDQVPEWRRRRAREGMGFGSIVGAGRGGLQWRRGRPLG